MACWHAADPFEGVSKSDWQSPPPPISRAEELSSEDRDWFEDETVLKIPVSTSIVHTYIKKIKTIDHIELMTSKVRSNDVVIS